MLLENTGIDHVYILKLNYFVKINDNTCWEMWGFKYLC
jgi:hypothetical protein